MLQKHLIAILCLTVFACSEADKQEKKIPEVFVVTATEHDYMPSRNFNARIDSRSDVNIQAQVSGKLISIHFKEGDQVTKGTPLFDIDAAPYKAALARANADLTKAKASETNSTRNFQRGKKLVKDGYISESEYDTLEARKLESLAQVEAALAAVKSAKVDLEYTRITAPQDGRVDRSIPAIGDIVSPQSGTLTTLIGQNDMDIVFQIPEGLLLSARNPDSKVKPKDITVIVGFSDGTEYPHTGTINYFSNRVDEATGTVETRSRILNPDDFLRQGMFVRAILRLSQPLQGLMVPQAAVQVDQRGQYVLVVDNNNTVTRKNLTTGERIAENVIIDSGLEKGAQVIVRGVQKARPGDKVIAKAYKPASNTNTANAEGKNSDQ